MPPVATKKAVAPVPVVAPVDPMESVVLPYKIQIYVPEHLRSGLKQLARDEGTSLQKLVVALLSASTKEAADAVRPAMRQYLARMS